MNHAVLLSCLLGLLLLCASSVQAEPVRQRLQKGDAFHVVVNADRVVRPANHQVMGISFFMLWDYLPIYDRRTGEWILRESASKAIESLHLPFARLYWMDQARPGWPSWDLQGSIDRAHELCQRFGIPEEAFVLEPELQDHSHEMSPAKWVAAVRYAQSKGYRFRYWEICNEPWGLGGPHDDAWTAEGYVEHVKAVYQAVKAARPELQVGCSAGVGPFNVFGGSQTHDPILANAAGYYDFISPHFYCHLQNLDKLPFERITLGGNAWTLNSYVMRTRELLEQHNPGKHIPILDTEWGLHGYNSGKDGRADDANRNGNIAGTLHRTIRMLYYLNEGLVDGAGQWCLLTPVDRPGFAIVTINDDRQFLLYYLNYYLGRYVGDEVVDTSGTCPYYELNDVPSDYTYTGAKYDVSMPKAPVLATKSRDGKHLFLVVANGTAAESLPCRIELKGFQARTVEAKRLTQAGIDSPALVEKGSDVVSALPVKLGKDGAALSFESAAHSVSFIELTAGQWGPKELSMRLAALPLMFLAVLLPCLSAFGAEGVPQHLRKGKAFQFTVDTAKVTRPVNRRVMGFAFHNMWDYTPLYSLKTGEWMVSESAVKAVRELRVPFGRTLWVDPASAGGADFGVKGGIDRAAEMCRRLGLPQEQFVLEVEDQEQPRALSPEAWADVVKYSLSKGYKFRLWEIDNEPGNLWGEPESEAWTREPYEAHVKAVYPAIKAVQPDALVGIDYGLGPFNGWGATQTEVPVLRDLVGYYDFVAPHFYCHLKDLDRLPLERITLGGNAWMLNSYIVKTRALLDEYNPGRHIQVLDTEWALHGYDHGDDRADLAQRNGNIAGTLHRAVRLIYYLNEGLLEAAAQFMTLGPTHSPGFTIVPLDDERLFTPYYLNYYLRRYVGDEVVDTSGTCPYYESRNVPSDYQWNGQASYDVSMPKAPVLATKSKDGTHLFLVVANGTAAENLPCHVDLRGFHAKAAEAKQLAGSPDAPALVEKESDVMRALPVKLSKRGTMLSFEAAAHSISFIDLTAK